MNPQSPIYEFKLELNETYLMNEYEQTKFLLEPYADPRVPEGLDNVKITRGLEDWKSLYVNEVTEMVQQKYGIKGFVSPRFFLMEKNRIFRPHIDIGARCSINHVLCGEDSEVFFTDIGSFRYKTALLNTSLKHGVVVRKEDRLLFKLSIFDEDYETVYKKLTSNNN